MPYRLRIPKAIEREIDRLPGHIRQRVRRAIAQLAYNPRPETAKALEDVLAGFYRIKSDNYRVIYMIDDEVLLVEIARVAKRTAKTYEGLPLL